VGFVGVFNAGGLEFINKAVCGVVVYGETEKPG
jgi:hypothetical protein